MQHTEIEKKAEEKVKAKKGYYSTAATFAFVSLILVIIAFIFPFPWMVRFWVLFPILIFGFVLAGMYVSIFGFPNSKFLSAEWEVEEKKREMEKLYRQQGLPLPTADELSEEDRLELKELERLREKWGDHQDYV